MDSFVLKRRATEMHQRSYGWDHSSIENHKKLHSLEILLKQSSRYYTTSIKRIVSASSRMHLNFTRRNYAECAGKIELIIQLTTISTTMDKFFFWICCCLCTTIVVLVGNVLGSLMGVMIQETRIFLSQSPRRIHHAILFPILFTSPCAIN